MFLVSEDKDIGHSVELLVAEGWPVAVASDCQNAEETLESNDRIVVVAHGSDDGTVYMCSAEGRPFRWLWRDMELESLGCRTYLYCCHAGAGLVPRFRHCEIFGHIDKVPIPVGDAKSDYVMQFLGLVLETVRNDNFDRDIWQKKFMEFLDPLFANLNDKDVDDDSGLDDFYALFLLRQSLNFGRPMW